MVFICAAAGDPLLGECKRVIWTFQISRQKIAVFIITVQILTQFSNRFNIIPFLGRTWGTFSCDDVDL